MKKNYAVFMRADNSDNFPAAEILQFWLHATAPEKWFMKDAAFDTEIRRRFGKVTACAQEGGYDSSAMSDDAVLALIIVLDQFSRNIYRQDSRCFGGDVRALALTKMLLARDAHKRFSTEQNFFLYLPLEHSENLADQELCVSLCEALGDEEFTHYARLHRDIIARFGRFPHRNAILGRQSTATELAFLQRPDSSF